MPDPRFARLFALLDEALELPEAERTGFVERAAADDPELLAAALAALQGDDGDAGRIRSTFVQALADPSAAERGAPADGRRCGPFRLLHTIGAGGMGEVFLAERVDGGFEQRVAIKLLPPDLRTHALRRRLARERQILARLEHPGIARLVDGGIAEDGTPYLALEYVEGVTLPAFLAERQPSLADRLRIFLELCDAVSYAHGRLVVHRDLKPTNVMIGLDGRAKLLDFGIAKLVEEDDLGLTGTAERVLTPRYAAPEQVRGEPATTATDVHGLGLLLYEMLTGERAFGGDTKSAVGLAREIVEREAPLPTARSKDLRSRREGRDVDAICGKALRKRPEERYASATALADDIRRLLAGEPVRARGGARLYRASRFVLRHRLLLSALAVVLLTLSTGLVVAMQARDRARASEARAVAIQRFLVDDLLLAGTPEEARGRELSVREVLAVAGSRASQALVHQPAIERGVRGVLADAYLRLGDLDAAARELERERAILPPTETKARFDNELRRLRLLLARKDFQTALAPATHLVAETAAAAPRSSEAAFALATLARVEAGLGRFARAESHYREARSLLAGHADEARADLAILSDLLTVLATQRRDLEGEVSARELAARTLALLGPDHPDQIRALARLAQALRRVEKYSEAEAVARQALTAARRVLPRGHELELESARAWISALRELRRFDEARQEAEELLSTARSSRGPDSLAAASAEELRAIFHSFDRDYAAAGELYAHALPILRRELGELHPTTIRVERNVAQLAVRRGDPEAARSASLHLVALARRAEDQPELDPVAVRDLALLALRAEPAELRDPALGRRLAERAVAASERRWMDGLATLAEANETIGDLAGAVATTRELFALPDALVDSSLLRAMLRRLRKLGGSDVEAQVDSFLADVAQRRRQLFPDDFALEADTLGQLARRDRERGRFAAAVEKLGAADALLAKQYSPTYPDRLMTLLDLVENLRSLGKDDEARRLLLAASERLAREPDADRDLRVRVEAALAARAGSEAPKR